MDADKTLKKLTIKQKMELISGKNRWETVDFFELSVPSFVMTDGPYGLRKVDLDEDGNSTTRESICYPTSSALAATFNRKLVYAVGRCIGLECARWGVDMILGPAVNIKRTPLCGRNFEYYSEDPVCAGELAASYIEGVQSAGAGACVKHFAANNQEFDRRNISAEVDERTLREIYLKPFEISIKKARPWSVMCSYNRINGIFSSENKWLLDEILRKEWGFDGFVVSDWGAVFDRARSLQATLELAMPHKNFYMPQLESAYEGGQITDAQIDEAALKILEFVAKKEQNKYLNCEINEQEHLDVALNASREAIVLLKNEGGILPLKNLRRVAIIGEFAKLPVTQGSGSAKVAETFVTNPLSELQKLLPDTKFLYNDTYLAERPMSARVSGACAAAMECDVAIVFAANRGREECEAYDRTTIRLSFEQEDAIIKVCEANPKTIVVVQAGSAIDMSRWIDKAAAVVFCYFGGQMSGRAQAEVLTGNVNPSGKLAETFPLTLSDNPAHAGAYGEHTYPGTPGAVWYNEGIFVGYRYYDTFNKNVLFPFGHGLSYTEFFYSDLKITPESAKEGQSVTVELEVKNIGACDGAEVVQLYVSDRLSTVLRPKKELKGFEKAFLKAGESKKVVFELDSGAFSYWSVPLKTWFVETGWFEILVGSSSREIRQSGKVFVKGNTEFFDCEFIKSTNHFTLRLL